MSRPRFGRLRQWWRDRWFAVRLLRTGSAGQLAAHLPLVVAGVVLPPALAYVEGRLIAAVTTTHHRGAPIPWAPTLCFGAIFLAIVLRAPAAAATGRLVSRTIDAGLRARVAATTAAAARIDMLERPETADTIRRVATGTGMVVVAVADGAGTLAGGLAGAAVVATFSPPLAGLLVAAVLVTRHHVWSRSARLARTMNAGTADLRRGQYWTSVAAAPWAAKEVLVFGLAGWAIGRRREHVRRGISLRWASRTRFLADFAAVTFGVLAVTFTATALLLAGALTRGGVTAGSMVFLLSSAAVAGNAIGAAPVRAAELRARIEALRGLEALESTALAPRPATATVGPPRRSIVFDAVCFAYPGADEFALDAVDLEIPAGRSVAIVGANGAGKTTLVKLLAGLYEPSGGRILVDGVDLATGDVHAWRSTIAAVFQDFVRYPLPLRDNVGLGAAPSADDPSRAAGLTDAAHRAGLDDVVARLSSGWDTDLSKEFQGGADLSGGEWQRVALARAFVGVARGRGVLVLDEPTANLDVRAEASFYESFLELTRGLTTVLISHRFASVRQADVIYVIDRGRVVECGTHTELVSRGGRYAAMYAVQTARFAASSPLAAVR
jgi:ATP-binding cassette, subfamily B, bacterial